MHSVLIIRMKRFIILIFIVGVCALSIHCRTHYSCFLSLDYNFDTGEISNQITNNSLADIYIDGNKLTLGSKRYSMYNERESNDGFIKVKHYDAIDAEGQRCKIKIIYDASADWTTRNAIVIWYDEISPIGKWYQSRDPETR